MINIINKFFSLLLVGFLSLFLISDVFAQTTPSVFTPFCFTSVQCNRPDAGCSDRKAHRAKLTIDPSEKPQPNSKVYVLECVSSEDGQHCTSGNKGIDDYLTYPAMPSSLNYKFEGLFEADGKTKINQSLANSLTTNTSGDLSVPVMEWQSSSKKSDRRFLGISEGEPTPTSDPHLGQGGQQLGETKFDWAGALKNCIPLTWDPDGTVFDSQSLEPIPNTLVTLTKKRANGLFTFVNKFDPEDVPTGILTNPYSTLEDGYFSFFVPDGIYKLTPQIPGYIFPASLSLNPNYSKIYSNIYPVLTGIEIVEQGGPQHRDIPVDPVGGQPTHFPVKIMEYSQMSNRVSNVFVDGRVSHPFATVNVYSVIPDSNNIELKIRNKLIKTYTADKTGRFHIVVDQSILDKNISEMFGEIEVIKPDYNQVLGVTSDSNNSNTPAVLKLNPILSYIEGNAKYKGQILPNAKIEILLDSSTKPYYQTTADSQGHFKIPSDYVPFMPYKLRYSLGTTVVNLTTSAFIADNSEYIKNNNKNVYYPQYSNQKINDSLKNNELNNNVGNSQQKDSPEGPDVNKNALTLKNPIIRIIFIIIILLIGIIASAIYLIKNKKQQIL